MNSTRVSLSGTSARRDEDVTCHSRGYANAGGRPQLIVMIDLSQTYDQVAANLSEGTRYRRLNVALGLPRLSRRGRNQGQTNRGVFSVCKIHGL